MVIFIYLKRNLQKIKLSTVIFIVFAFTFSITINLNEKQIVIENIEVNDKFEQIKPILESYQSSLVFFFISGPRITNNIAKCCVISAARRHPKSAVIVFLQKRMKQPLLWKTLKNIFAVQLTETFLLENTPLQKWYANETYRQSSLWDYHLGDALRLVYLWKYGGIYLDTDVFVLKNLFDSFQNSLAYENAEKTAIDGAILIFDKFHPFINLAMNKFVDEFRDTWGYQGPSLMLRTYETYKNLHLDSLAAVNVLNSSTFYPISWKNLEIKKLYQKNYFEQMYRTVDGSWAIHLWNKASKSFQLEKGSLLEHLLSTQCIRR